MSDFFTDYLNQWLRQDTHQRHALLRSAYNMQANPLDRTPKGLRKAKQVNQYLKSLPLERKMELVKMAQRKTIKIMGVVVVW